MKYDLFNFVTVMNIVWYRVNLLGNWGEATDRDREHQNKIKFVGPTGVYLQVSALKYIIVLCKLKSFETTFKFMIYHLL